MCDYCDENGQNDAIEDEYGEYEMRVVKLTPLPAINLTTGEVDKYAEPPYYALFAYYMEEKCEQASFPIKY